MEQPVVTLIILVIATIYPTLCSLAVALFKHLVSRLPQSQQDFLDRAVDTIVQGVEQSAKSGAIDMKNRKDAARSAIDEILEAKKIKLPDSLIDLTIEAAVAALPKTTP
jgi:hypothetical protein